MKDTDPERKETDREQDNQGEHQEPGRAARDDLSRGEGRAPGPPGKGRVTRPQFRVGRTKSAVHPVEDCPLAAREDHVAPRGYWRAVAPAFTQ